MARTLSRSPNQRRTQYPRTFMDLCYRPIKKDYVELADRKDWDGKIEVLTPCGDGCRYRKQEK